MKSLFKIGCLILFASLLPSCIINMEGGGFHTEQKDSCGFAVSRYSGEGVRWDEIPVSFYIHQSVPAPAHQNFVSAVDHWNMAWEEHLTDKGLESLPLFAVVNRDMQYSGSPKNDGHNILFFTDRFKEEGYGNVDTQAVTGMFYSRQGEIRDTDIVVNNNVILRTGKQHYFYDENYNNEIVLSKREIKENRRLASLRIEGGWFQLKQKIWSWFQFFLKPFQKEKIKRQIASPSVKIPKNYMDFASLMIHELGHVPGLGHFDKSDQIQNTGKMASGGRRYNSKSSFISVMERKLRSGTTRRMIGEHDLENLFCGYFNY